MIVRLIQALSFLLSRFSHRALQRIGRGFGWVLATCVPVRRREVYAALRQAFPEKTEAERRAIARGMYRHLALTAVECLAYTAPGSRDFAEQASIEGLDHLRAALDRGRGVLYLMGHIGNWECMGRVLAAAGHPPYVVVRGFRNKAFQAYWREARLRLDIRALDREHSLRACLRLLRQQETLAMVIDQNTRAHRGLFVEFFGRPACTTPGLAQLAARTRSPVVPLHIIRRADGRHCVTFGKPLDPPADHNPETIHAATQHYTRILENTIRAHPDQWLWGHRRWRTQPKHTEPAPHPETAKVDSP